eukprot:1485457-Prymnesium_polylepis.1
MLFRTTLKKRSTWSAFCSLFLRYVGVKTPHVERIEGIGRPPGARTRLLLRTSRSREPSPLPHRGAG